VTGQFRNPYTLTCESPAVRVEVGVEQDSVGHANGYLDRLDRGVDL
jgi:hypothetical protein